MSSGLWLTVIGVALATTAFMVSASLSPTEAEISLTTRIGYPAWAAVAFGLLLSAWGIRQAIRTAVAADRADHE